jgi:hypothetical protein
MDRLAGRDKTFLTACDVKLKVFKILILNETTNTIEQT